VTNGPDHWAQLAEFCRWETAVGGPDPHMALVGKLSEHESLAERIWRGGCYIGVYNVPVAQALWTAWPWDAVRGFRVSEEDLTRWLAERWDGIVTRRERRAVRRPEQLARFLCQYAVWAELVPARRWFDGSGPADARERYEAAWVDCQTVYALGRYVALKILEYLRRYCDAPILLPDLRAAGGWSPRAALALLFPDRAESLTGGDSEHDVSVANATAAEAGLRLRWDFDIDLDTYRLQVLLCDYKQSWAGRRQYPGRSHDSEFVYYDRVAEFWNLDRSMFDARALLFPAVALGELAGWDAVRDDLGHVLVDHGYTWSDLRFDYLASRDDLAHPVERPVTL
jgi:hypothetical protein